MSCITFQLTRRGDLSIAEPDKPVLYLWADEVAKLRPLLDRPTPAAAVQQQISLEDGLEVWAILFDSGNLRFSLTLDSADERDVWIDHRHTLELRRLLGIPAPRDDESRMVTAFAVRENYGPADDREHLISIRADLARRRAIRKAAGQRV